MTMAVEGNNVKFRVKADLALFEAIQKDGKLSEGRLAHETNIPSTTVHYAMERIKRRDFFQIKAVPRLEKFPEIPMAIIGFSSVHPAKVRRLEEEYAGKPELMQFMRSEKDVVLLVMDSSMDGLTKRLFRIMELAAEKPCIYITSPVIVRFGVAIPDSILDAVYADLPDRRIKV